jgi:glycosyltransferase involved in cell wall biosynthesis
MNNKKIFMGENLVWNSVVRVGSHHYAKLFSNNGNEVFWLSLPWSPFHLLKGLGHERIQEWNYGKPTIVRHNLSFYCPLTFFPYRNNMVLRSNYFAHNLSKFVYPNLHKVLKKANFEQVDILWLSDPRYVRLIDIVRFDILAYRCVDAMETFSDVPRGVLQLEEELVKEANIVFVTSRSLEAKLKKWRNDIIYLPNGLDLESFIINDYREPDDIKAISRPRIIYTGTLGEWFDVDTIAYAAKSLPDFQFILIGPIRTDCRSLQSLRNVFLFGPRKFETMPHYLKFSDIAVIPFLKNELSDAVNPIKLFEYFSAGLPVISANLNGVIQMASPAMIYRSSQEFVDILESMRNLRVNREKYVAFSKENTWQKRYETVIANLEKVRRRSRQ